jgi:hypothetical protein
LEKHPRDRIVERKPPRRLADIDLRIQRDSILMNRFQRQIKGHDLGEARRLHLFVLVE